MFNLLVKRERTGANVAVAIFTRTKKGQTGLPVPEASMVGVRYDVVQYVAARYCLTGDAAFFQGQ